MFHHQSFHIKSKSRWLLIEQKNISITIDGLSGCCKSLLAKKLAKEFSLLHINSGLIYRFITYQMLICKKNPNEISPSDLSFINELQLTPDGIFIYNDLSLDESFLQNNTIQNNVYLFAQNSFVREVVTNWIRQTAFSHNVVIDGRDAGTTILPNADVKVFITSSVEHRVNNWCREQIEKFGTYEPEQKLKYAQLLQKKDYEDLHRTISPLRCPDNAHCFQNDIEGFEIIYKTVCSIVTDMLLQFK